MLLVTIIDHALIHLFCLSGTCSEPFLSKHNCIGEMALEPDSDMRKKDIIGISVRFWLDFYSCYAIWLSSQAMLRS